MTTALTILGLSLLIVLHELGHFLAARAFGMKVHRFSIGFGPPLLYRRFGGTVWQLAAVPLGGFVQIAGMGPEDADDPEGGNFRDKPRWQRAVVLFAGPAANWLIAAACLAVLAMTVGLRSADNAPRLGDIDPSGAAAAAGLAAGDRILAVDGQVVTTWDDLVREIRRHPAAAVPFELEREGARLTIAATPRPSESGGYGVLGVGPPTRMVQFGAAAGLAAGLRATAALTADQARLLWGVITGRLEGRLSGLPGIVRTLSDQARRGFARFVETLATLSVVLFLLNLAPVPALDGSRLAFLGIEAIRRRPLDQLVEGWVHGIGFVLLLGLMVFVSVRDLL